MSKWDRVFTSCENLHALGNAIYVLLTHHTMPDVVVLRCIDCQHTRGQQVQSVELHITYSTYISRYQSQVQQNLSYKVIQRLIKL